LQLSPSLAVVHGQFKDRMAAYQQAAKAVNIFNLTASVCFGSVAPFVSV
jgi:hypothetical protein